MSWKIGNTDGVYQDWTGAVVTIGSDKYFTNIEDALAAISENTLYLVDPGSYGILELLSCPYDVYVRGLGASPTEVIFSNSSRSNTIGTKNVFENILLLANFSASNAGASLTLSKCLTSVEANTFIQCQSTPTEVIVRYCTAAREYPLPDVDVLYTATINCSIIKCQFYSVSAVTYTLDDHVIVPTVNYGVEYGDYLIKEFISVLSSISVSVSDSIMIKGQQQQAVAIAIYESGDTEDVTDSVVWSSSNSSILSVNSSGLVTAIASGTATITATNTVTDSELNSSLVISGSCDITVAGEAIPLKAKYSGGVPVALAEFGAGDKISVTYLPVSSDDELLSDSDQLISSQKAVKAYVDAKAKYPMRIIYPSETVIVGVRQEYVVMSGVLFVQGVLSLGVYAIVFIGTTESTFHNDTLDIQGGTTDEYYHLTAAKKQEVDYLHVPADGEITLTPKVSSSSTAEGTIFYCSDDKKVYVGVE